ncbi:MAG: 2Fe-2S iron-sulfur cluster binding domain-containing protein [Myxococcales bacterium]|nr:2Fe-2S iron-sulfur cluster binding domain-containing protein [Myxococcales bacterium]
MSDGTITIDGRPVPFDKGDTIIKAAYEAGIEIPHYCWHPGLSAPANCRMCLVEIEPPPGRDPLTLDILRWDAEKNDYVPTKKVKLLPACQQACSEGLSVKSDTSAEVDTARHAVQEFLLLNHPVDCPICDQAGECKLQDYWLEHQSSKKRMSEEPVHKPKGVVFGETIIYDAERCIMCTRCIRVSDEVAKDPVLDMRERGNRNEIVLSPGRTLDHNYSLMTEHVCPVGALTSSHFRFKARVWFLRSGDTVCQGCATGCSAHLDYDPRDNTAYRYRPRDNKAVNGYWMCDVGMLSYPEAHEARIERARVHGKDAELVDAIAQAKKLFSSHASDPSRIAIVLGARHSNEDNQALARVAKIYLGATHFYLSRRKDGHADDILMVADRNSNAAGVHEIARNLGLGDVRSLADLVRDIAALRIDFVISLGADIDGDESEAMDQLRRVKGFVAIAAHEGPLAKAAHVVLPAASWAESPGTYVNRNGIAQITEGVLKPRGDAHPAWQLVIALTRALGYEVGWKKRGDLQAGEAAQ